jgi:hypothetical protein
MSDTFKGIRFEFVEGEPEPGAATINQTRTANPAPGKTWSELIRCPECKTDQWATVEQDDGVPFARYIHDCRNCGHVILESEWNRVSNAGGELEQAKARIAELESHIQTATKAVETRDRAIAELERARARLEAIDAALDDAGAPEATEARALDDDPIIERIMLWKHAQDVLVAEANARAEIAEAENAKLRAALESITKLMVSMQSLGYFTNPEWVSRLADAQLALTPRQPDATKEGE